MEHRVDGAGDWHHWAATAEPGTPPGGRLGRAPTGSLLAVLEARQEARRTRRRAGARRGTPSRRVQAAHRRFARGHGHAAFVLTDRSAARNLGNRGRGVDLARPTAP